ncbi:MAG: hypothetical protein EB023_15140 [Flavobacteriia bacterium]|nr:hypothetical protein [Flavobacteriia bacterium]
MLLQYLNTKIDLTHYLQQDFEISTQFTDSNDSSIPDLALLFGSGKLLVEVKFWAKLTKNQPLTYLQKLNKADGECLFFLVPKLRIPSLLNELIQKSALEIKGELIYETNGNVILLQDFAPIIVLSWEEILSVLMEYADYTAVNAKADLAQLKQMIDKMLSPSFLPFEVGDFEFYAYRKHIQLIELIDACVDANPEMNTKNMSYGGGRNSFQRWFMVQDYYTCGLELHARYWEQYGNPVWLVIYGSSWVNKGQIPHLEMAAFEANLKSAKLSYEVVKEAGYRKLIFNIQIPYGEDKETCLNSMNNQLNTVLELLPKKQEA